MKNDNSKFLQGISDTATIESLKEYEKTILELQQTYKQTLDSMLEAAKNYQNKAKDNTSFTTSIMHKLTQRYGKREAKKSEILLVTAWTIF